MTLTILLTFSDTSDPSWNSPLMLLTDCSLHKLPTNTALPVYKELCVLQVKQTHFKSPHKCHILLQQCMAAKKCSNNLYTRTRVSCENLYADSLPSPSPLGFCRISTFQTVLDSVTKVWLTSIGVKNFVVGAVVSSVHSLTLKSN